MFRRSNERAPQVADELREKFITNREQVRSWLTGWDCPELTWPPFAEVPQPWVVRPGEERGWLNRHAPSMTEYRWLCIGQPTIPDVTHGFGLWEFATTGPDSSCSSSSGRRRSRTTRASSGT